MDKDKEKVKKLVSAVYLVTSLISPEETLRLTLRKKSLDLLSFTSVHKDNYEITSRVEEIISLLSVGKIAGVVSQMNFSVLEQEFSKLIDAFEPSVALPDLLNAQKQEKIALLSHTLPHRSHQILTSSQKSYRQTTILDLAKKTPGLSVKNIAVIIKDCSEKTIQRELNFLIAKGLLRRTGVKRWSKYSIV